MTSLFMAGASWTAGNTGNHQVVRGMGAYKSRDFAAGIVKVCVHFSDLLYGGGVDEVVHNAPLLCALFTIYNFKYGRVRVAAGRDVERR